ncbi:MAG: hypothetical protein HZA28_03055 [Candidatus Omnitrophica bacterium]|nr:hypothetical protein [Candidatus Omnitrophota bacterium]
MVSYYDNANADLKVAKCGNVSCSSGNTITTVDSGQIGLDSSIAIGTDGLPVIAYSINIVSNALKVAKCGNASCSAGNTLTTVELTGAYYPSIVIGTDGFPVISYYDSTTDLKVAKCGNASCSSGNTITTVDSTGDVGSYTSIAKGTDGFPVIAYYDLTNYYLKAAKCGNASCSSGNTFTIVDSTGFVNYRTFPSIAISTDGEPVISYYDNTNTNLKVAKGNSCGGGGTPAPMVSLWADQTTIASGGSVTLTWASTNAASCAAVSPAGWTASTAINGSQLVTNITATTTYIISCTGAGGTTQQSATVTVSGGGGVACGQQIFDGTTAITIPCEDPPVSQLRVQKNGTTYGIGVVATTDPNASKIRIQTPSGVKALRKQ